jgi:hypothetical protein
MPTDFGTIDAKGQVTDDPLNSREIWQYPERATEGLGEIEP